MKKDKGVVIWSNSIPTKLELKLAAVLKEGSPRPK